MNENDKLKPDDTALRLFFKEDTLYLKKEAAETERTTQINSPDKISLENPAIPVFEGGKNASLLMLFSHNSASVLADDWGAMVSGLIQNERAMNLKADEVCLVNLKKNTEMSLEVLLAHFPAKKVLLWGDTGNSELDRIPVMGMEEFFGKRIYKLEAASAYMAKETKATLWQFIKSHILA